MSFFRVARPPTPLAYAQCTSEARGSRRVTRWYAGKVKLSGVNLKSFWKALLAHVAANRGIWLLIAVGFLAYSHLSLIRHWHFASNGYDLGIFDQAIWKYSRFLSPEITVHGKHILGEHFHPILILLAPLYWILPRAEVLLVVQAFTLSIAALPVYLFAKKRLGVWPALLMAATYLTFWGIQLTALYDFHEVSLAVPLVALAVYAVDLKKWRQYWVSLVLLLLCKENMSLLAVGFGVHLLLLKEYKRAWLTILAGVSWFILTIKLIIPHFAGGVYEFWKYNELGSGPRGALASLILHPLRSLAVLFNQPEKRETLWLLFYPFAFLFVASPLVILLVPLILERFLSDTQNLWTASYHYNAVVAPVLVMATADGVWRVTRLIRSVKARSYVVFLLCFLIVTTQIGITIQKGYPLLSYSRVEKLNLFSKDSRWEDAMAAFEVIPDGASVSAQDPIVPHLSGRKEIYSLNAEKDTDYYIRGMGLNTWPLVGEWDIDGIFNRRLSEGYQKVFEQGGWVVLQKKGSR